MQMKVPIIPAVLITLLTYLTTGCDSSPKPVLPENPVKAANRVMQAMSEYKPLTLWQAIPKDYQKDVTTSVSDYVQIIDKDNYSELSDLIRRLAVTINQKKQIIENSILKLTPVRYRKQALSFTKHAMKLLTTFEGSQLQNYSKMQKPNITKLVDRHGQQLILTLLAANPRDKAGYDRLYKGRFKLAGKKQSKPADKNASRVHLLLNGYHITLIKHQNHWVPVDIYTTWQMKMNRHRKTISMRNSKRTAINKKLRKLLPLLKTLVSQFESVKNEAQLLGFIFQAKVAAAEINKIMR